MALTQSNVTAVVVAIQIKLYDRTAKNNGESTPKKSRSTTLTASVVVVLFLWLLLLRATDDDVFVCTRAAAAVEAVVVVVVVSNTRTMILSLFGRRSCIIPSKLFNHWNDDCNPTNLIRCPGKNRLVLSTAAVTAEAAVESAPVVAEDDDRGCCCCWKMQPSSSFPVDASDDDVNFRFLPSSPMALLVGGGDAG